MGRMYTASFSSVAVTAAQDLFEVVAPADSAVILHSVRIGQSTEEGDSAAEMINIQISKYTGTSGSGGSSPTVYPMNLGDAAFGGTVEANNTTQATTTQVIVSDAWNLQIGYLYQPAPEERVVLSPSTGLVVECPDTVADSVTMSGTITFEEIGG